MTYSFVDRNRIIHEVSSQEIPQLYSIGNLPLFLNKHTLVPHPDTIRLVTIAKAYIHTHSSIQTIADIGTGSGYIAITLAQTFPDKQFFATDVSAQALTVARQNATYHKCQNITFYHNTDQIWLSELSDTIDFLISNPPFVGTREYDSPEFKSKYPEVLLEPIQAIRTNDENGLEPYHEMLKQAHRLHTSAFLFHCNELHIPEVLQLSSKILPEATAVVRKDDLRKDRFILITR